MMSFLVEIGRGDSQEGRSGIARLRHFHSVLKKQ